MQWLLLLLLLSGWLLEREVEGLMQLLLPASLLECSYLCGQQEEVLDLPLEFLELCCRHDWL